MESRNLSNEELLKQYKLMKKTKLWDAVLFGFLVGIAIFSTVNKGLGLLTFLPLVYLPIAGKNKKRREELEGLVKERGLQPTK